MPTHGALYNRNGTTEAQQANVLVGIPPTPRTHGQRPPPTMAAQSSPSSGSSARRRLVRGLACRNGVHRAVLPGRQGLGMRSAGQPPHVRPRAAAAGHTRAGSKLPPPASDAVLHRDAAGRRADSTHSVHTHGHSVLGLRAAPRRNSSRRARHPGDPPRWHHRLRSTGCERVIATRPGPPAARERGCQRHPAPHPSQTGDPAPQARRCAGRLGSAHAARRCFSRPCQAHKDT